MNTSQMVIGQRRVNPHVVLQAMGEGALLMNTDTGDCFELNRVGSEIWNSLQQGTMMSEVIELIVSRYAAEREAVHADVMSLVTELTRHGILIPE